MRTKAAVMDVAKMDAEFMARAEPILARFKVWGGDPCLTAQAPTGEVFVSLESGGVRSETQPSLLFARTREAAERNFLMELAEYVKDKPEGATLYWRHEPEFSSATFYHETLVLHHGKALVPQEMWTGYCRLLISDKPVLAGFQQKIDAAYERLNAKAA